MNCRAFKPYAIVLPKSERIYDVEIFIGNVVSAGVTDLSVNEITGSGLTLYPNPTKKMVKIEGIEPAEVQVYNALGQLMKTFYHTNSIDLGNMPKGVYALRVLGSDGAFAAFKVAKE